MFATYISFYVKIEAVDGHFYKIFYYSKPVHFTRRFSPFCCTLNQDFFLYCTTFQYIFNLLFLIVQPIHHHALLLLLLSVTLYFRGDFLKIIFHELQRMQRDHVLQCHKTTTETKKLTLSSR
jgi:hypothetical protein